MLYVVLAFFGGEIVGIVVTGLCAAAKRGDKQ